MNKATRERLETLAEDLRTHVFEALDNEPAIDSEFAGKAAALIEATFMVMMVEADPQL